MQYNQLKCVLRCLVIIQMHIKSLGFPNPVEWVLNTEKEAAIACTALLGKHSFNYFRMLRCCCCCFYTFAYILYLLSVYKLDILNGAMLEKYSLINLLLHITLL